ncbi:hypothetical protein [Paenibacillus sp. FSL L8-0709]|uniref:hypothetical protein n=1 Tax=Paenibacillus sp. FSL L8-0709 TaxID=2975312 RepID=UPI0030FBF1A5
MNRRSTEGMSDAYLNALLADLCGYEYFSPIKPPNRLIVRKPKSGRTDFFDPCNNYSDAKEVQDKALEEDMVGFIHQLDLKVIPSGCRLTWGYDEVRAMMSASPREISESAYTVLQRVLGKEKTFSSQGNKQT